MQTLYLIRHGDVENPTKMFYGRDRDVALSKKGIEQIRRLGVYLAKNNIIPHKIFTSPMTRAVQTAKFLKESFSTKPPVSIEDALNETYSSGLLGKNVKQLFALGDFYSVSHPGIVLEKPNEIVRRVRQFADGILRSYPGQTIFFVSHGDPLAFFLSSLVFRDKPPSIVWLRNNMYLQKGEAWEVVFKEGTSSVSYEKITVL